MGVCFFFQAEDGIRDLVRSRGLGDVYKRQRSVLVVGHFAHGTDCAREVKRLRLSGMRLIRSQDCLLYTSDAADERSRVDLGGRRIIKKKKT